jgi:hypothetical protein
MSSSDKAVLFHGTECTSVQPLPAREPFSTSADNNTGSRTARDYMVRFIMAETKVCT